MRIPDFKIERYFAKYEFSTPYMLSGSDCESLSVKGLLALEADAAERLQELHLGYTESEGDPALRAEIARLYEHIAPEHVLVHSGAEEAIFTFMNAALQANDHIIVHSPAYQSLHELARSIGCEVTLWQTRQEDGWQLDLNFLVRAVQKNTRVIVINCPNNPTGYLLSRSELEHLGAFARAHGIILFSDEVYGGLEYQPDDQLPAICDLDERAVSLGVMSKSFGLPGLRIGWIATRNQELRQRIAALKDYTTICNSAPAEFLATLALRHKDHLLDRNRALVKENLAMLRDFMVRKEDMLTWAPPHAGPIAFPTLRHGDNAEVFCQQIRETAGVLLLPGSVFGDEYTHHFRLGFGRKNFPECLSKLDTFLRKM